MREFAVPQGLHALKHAAAPNMRCLFAPQATSITGNDAVYGNGGGGLYMQDAVAVSLDRCTVSNNRVLKHGGGVYAYGSTDPVLSITDSYFQGNAGSYGPSLYIRGASVHLSGSLLDSGIEMNEGVLNVHSGCEEGDVKSPAGGASVPCTSCSGGVSNVPADLSGNCTACGNAAPYSCCGSLACETEARACTATEDSFCPAMPLSFSSPTDTPVSAPVPAPTLMPNPSPSITPTQNPSLSPTYNPTPAPSPSPSLSPTQVPSYGDKIILHATMVISALTPRLSESEIEAFRTMVAHETEVAQSNLRAFDLSAPWQYYQFVFNVTFEFVVSLSSTPAPLTELFALSVKSRLSSPSFEITLVSQIGNITGVDTVSVKSETASGGEIEGGDLTTAATTATAEPVPAPTAQLGRR